MKVLKIGKVDCINLIISSLDWEVYGVLSEGEVMSKIEVFEDKVN